MAIQCGISALSHDASFSIIDDINGEILYASHSERFSRVKNDFYLSKSCVDIINSFMPETIVWYERPYLKKSRQLISGQWSDALSLSDIPSTYLKSIGIKSKKIEYVDHHLSHISAGFNTSSFDTACGVVIDAIGEWSTITIWKLGSIFEKVKEITYPSSLGLLYTAFTQRIGLKPNEEEYILMGMAAYGNPIYVDQILNDYIEVDDVFYTVKVNCHRGIGNYLPNANVEDLAASIQVVIELAVESILNVAKNITNECNLVYMGGVALNCVANKYAYKIFNDVWIMPNPGDSGSSLGSVSYFCNKKLLWDGPYLGYGIEGDYPIDDIADELLKNNICGVANGRAEFGPRALGNRSLLADPRGNKTKGNVNLIKKRESFRPFAPVIMEEHLHDYFDAPCDALPYMQLTVPCKYPNKYPAIVHHDGTSRVQTVNESQHKGLYNLLKIFYETTGCPMLLNTSLNIKGEPLVNNKIHAQEFETKYNIKVL